MRRAALPLAPALAALALLASSTGRATGPAGPDESPARDAPAKPAWQAAADRWHALLKAGDDAAARTACEESARSPDALVAAEGHKCLANVELRAAMSLASSPGAAGPAPEAIARALAHLDAAIAKAPADLSIHRGRVDVLLVAGRFGDVAAAVASSLATFPGDALEAWLGVASDLFELGRFEESLAVLRLIETRGAGDHRVAGNLGAVLSMLERDEEALRHLVRATELAPSDPVDRWNLARHLEFMGRDDEAAASYARWSELETDPDRRARQSCVFASFVETKRRDLERACRLQKEFCPEPERTACTALAAPATAPRQETP